MSAVIRSLGLVFLLNLVALNFATVKGAAAQRKQEAELLRISNQLSEIRVQYAAEFEVVAKGLDDLVHKEQLNRIVVDKLKNHWYVYLLYFYKKGLTWRIRQLSKYLKRSFFQDPVLLSNQLELQNLKHDLELCLQQLTQIHDFIKQDFVAKGLDYTIKRIRQAIWMVCAYVVFDVVFSFLCSLPLTIAMNQNSKC